MDAALPGSGHGSTSGLVYPAHPGTKQAGAWPGLTPGTSGQPHLPQGTSASSSALHPPTWGKAGKSEIHSYPPYSQWAGSPIHYLDVVGFGLVWFLDCLINAFVTAN